MIIVYDLETTGFLNEFSQDPEEQPGLTQIGAAKYDDEMNLLDQLDMFVNPELSNPAMWREDAMEVSNIRPEDVKDAKTAFQAIPEFAEFCLGAKYFVGYNHIHFDNKVLMWQLVRYGFEHHFPWPPIHVDVMDMAAEHLNIRGKRGRKNPKLGEIYLELFGKELEGAHNALFDVLGTGDVFRELGGLEQCGYIQPAD